MSKAIEKAAEFGPSELFLLSMLAGGGAFGGTRLLTDLHNNLTNTAPPDNSIKLQLPNPHKHHEENNGMASVDPSMGTQLPALNKMALDDPQSSFTNPPTIANTFAKPLAIMSGLPIGFLGVKALYDRYQQSEQDKQIAAVKKQYGQQLLMAQQATAKLAEETPNVDNLCEAMASELEKKSGAGKIVGDLVGDVAKKAWGGVKTPLGITSASILGGGAAAYGGLKEWPISGNSLIPSISPNTVAANAPTDPGSMAQYASEASKAGREGFNKSLNVLGLGVPYAAEDAWKDVFGLTTVGLLGMLIHNHNNKKAREQKAEYPTNITYAN